MSRTPDQALAALTKTQHNVFSTEHARICGFTADQIEHRLATGEWEIAHLNAYRVAGAADTWKGRLLSACWAGGFRAVASHRSAAALYGLAGGREDLAEITCPRWRRARHPGVEVHETKVLDPIDIGMVDGIPVTGPERTLFELGAVCGPRVVLMAFDKARKHALVTYDSTQLALRRLARRGRPGSRILRFVLASRDPEQAPPESEMETLMLDVIMRHGLPAPVPQFEIVDPAGNFVARADAAYPERRIAIEYQSYQEHADPEAVVRDSRRRKALQAIHWDVVEATAPELHDGGGQFCAALRAMLEGAA
ncbi:MAG TPA: hypothetical protein VF152_01350 [Acidimicrobiia bacterium]